MFPLLYNTRYTALKIFVKHNSMNLWCWYMYFVYEINGYYTFSKQHTCFLWHLRVRAVAWRHRGYPLLGTVTSASIISISLPSALLPHYAAAISRSCVCPGLPLIALQCELKHLDIREIRTHHSSQLSVHYWKIWHLPTWRRGRLIKLSIIYVGVERKAKNILRVWNVLKV